MSAIGRDFPLSPEEVTTEFLSACFGKEVTSFKLDTSMIDGGVLADAFKVEEIKYLEKQDETDLISSCFIKCTKDIPEVVDMSLSTQIYAKEVYFYSKLINRIKKAIRVPECYGIFTDKDDKDCKDFCIVLEDLSGEDWEAYEQFENPMGLEDLKTYMLDLASFHAASWNEPISDQPGLGVFRPHWQNLNDEYWDNGTTTWNEVKIKWKEIYGEPFELLAGDEVKVTIEKIAEIFTSENGKKIQDALLKRLESRPRTITHGDARGNNVFKSKSKGNMALIDWQMWVAGPCSNEFCQIWLNSWSLESGMVFKLEEVTRIYYKELCRLRPEVEKDYPFDDMFFDMKLIFINMWNQYQGFAAGALDGYKDPKQKKAKENFYNLFQRSMETLHYSNCLDTFEEFINLLERK